MNDMAYGYNRRIVWKIEAAAKAVGDTRKEEEQWTHFVTMYNQIQELRKRQHKKGKATRVKDFTQFKQWLVSNGISESVFETIDFAVTQNEDVGVVAKKDIAQGDVLVHVPKKLMLSSLTPEELNTSLFQLVQNDSRLRHASSKTTLVALQLLCEKHNHDSFWAPYLKILPASYSTCLYWTLEDLQALRGSPAFVTAYKVITTVAHQYAYIYGLLEISSGVLHVASFTWDEWVWAMSAVMTRQNAFPLKEGNAQEPEIVLVPGWDMFNHDTGEITTFYNPSTMAVECTASRACKQGDQVYIFYGPRRNADLLIHSGFVPDSNEHDYLSVRVRLPHDTPAVRGKLTLLHLNDMKMDSQYRLYGDGLPIELLAFLRIYAMNEDEVNAALEASGESTASAPGATTKPDEPKGKEKASSAEEASSAKGKKFDPKEVGNVRNETEAHKLARDLCYNLLKAYPTTKEADEKKLQKQLPKNIPNIIKLLIQEKEILAKTIGLIEGVVGKGDYPSSAGSSSSTTAGGQQQSAGGGKKKRNRNKKKKNKNAAGADAGGGAEKKNDAKNVAGASSAAAAPTTVGDKKEDSKQ